MNARFMRKGVTPNDGFIRLHLGTDDRRQHLAGGIEFVAVDARLEWQLIAAHFQRHHDLFQRRIAGPFTNTVDGAFNLSRTRFDRRQTVRYGQAQIVVTMHADHHPAIADYPVMNRPY